MAKRKAPGSTGKGHFYRIEIRRASDFDTFRMQDVGQKGGLERMAGKRANGSWDTVAWLISKDHAAVVKGHLVIKEGKDKGVLKQIQGPIVHKTGDIFKAHPKNVPEASKPTPAMRRAQKANIRKAQLARANLGSKGYVVNIEKVSLQNAYFRQVLFTDTNVQLVVMALKPQEDIGEEVHSLDQFIRVEAGEGFSILDGAKHAIKAGSGVVIPKGVRHNILNTSRTKSMKLYTIYAPPNHKDGTIHKTKADAVADEGEHFDGETTR